ncbi:uncharacterized protein LOC129222175 isoform X2 [Uloborus diversus]|uniref:uncharacterized protein LOC129222175 isoform X2 n=1 Tax=Uloborus diversus TaxID=327109 RepID=UPI0024096CD6|nr:uncharacterized protein LOC129222175 isoform X2 [Uloborus diversus]
MIILFILPILLPTTEAAFELAPHIFAADGVDGVFYESPEYDEPEVVMNQLEAMGVRPVLTLLEISNQGPENSSEEDVSYYEQLAEVQKSLEEIIDVLHTARTKLEKGSTHILTDVNKSVLGLKRLERKLKPRVPSIGGAIRQSISFQSSGFNPVIKMEGERTMTTTEAIDPENPQSNEREQTVTETPYGKDIYIKESKKVGDGAFQKKWTWKSSSVI